MASSLILVANPGTASRKYALFKGGKERAALHFELVEGRVTCTYEKAGIRSNVAVDCRSLQQAAEHVTTILFAHGDLYAREIIDRIALRIVAPGSYFLYDHIVDDAFVAQLETARDHAPLHIAATLEELRHMRELLPSTPIIGVSDSAFHITKPDYAWNYGIDLDLADQYDLKRFGYHGLSAASAIRSLRSIKKLPQRMVFCHIGSGVSVSALYHGKSVDTTMGYSPLEGLIMSTRSGSIDPTVLRIIKEVRGFDDAMLEDFLNHASGLQGLGGSSDVRELRIREQADDHRARLALQTYVYAIQKAIGQMTAALGGLDALVISGTVGERSAVIRSRILDKLGYLDLELDPQSNSSCDDPTEPVVVSRLAHSKPIIVVPADEAAQMAHHADGI